MSTLAPHGHPLLGLTVYTPVITIMATIATDKKEFVLNESVTARIERAESRKNIFLIWLEGYDVPVIVSKSIMADDFYVHKSQLNGVLATVTPTQPSNGTQPSFLANVDIAPANANNNQLVLYKQQAAIRYQQAAQYNQTVAEEV